MAEDLWLLIQVNIDQTFIIQLDINLSGHITTNVCVFLIQMIAFAPDATREREYKYWYLTFKTKCKAMNRFLFTIKQVQDINLLNNDSTCVFIYWGVNIVIRVMHLSIFIPNEGVADFRLEVMPNCWENLVSIVIPIIMATWAVYKQTDGISWQKMIGCMPGNETENNKCVHPAAHVPHQAPPEFQLPFHVHKWSKHFVDLNDNNK